MFRIFVLSLLYILADGYKIAIFAPDISNSQILYNSRVAETLSNAGHDVTMIVLQWFNDDDKPPMKIDKNIKIYKANATCRLPQKEFERNQTELAFEDMSIFDSRLRGHLARMMSIMSDSCETMVKNKEFLSWLPEQKFDIAFVHMFHPCPIGLIHIGKIPSWIWLNSGALMDYVASAVGSPTFPSYMPTNVMESLDEMNFFERCKSNIGHILMNVFHKRKAAEETEIFRTHVDPDFPSLYEMEQKCPLVMVNSNELYEFPRPSLAKIINIGGLGVSREDARPLTGDYLTLSEKPMVIFSFGSVAPSHLMPKKWKEAIMTAFARFPHIQFLMRYSENDLDDILPKNVYLSKWLPQKDLLLHKNTKAFISHGGYNSLQEALTAGIPLVCIPLFGDQPKNSKVAEKHGFALSVLKADFSADALSEAIENVLQNSKYDAAAKRISRMILKQPVSPAQLLVKWTEFAAEFKTLENLVPAGEKLNWFQYHSIDVWSFFALLVFFVLFIVYKTVKSIVCKVCSCVKPGNLQYNEASIEKSTKLLRLKLRGRVAVKSNCSRT